MKYTRIFLLVIALGSLLGACRDSDRDKDLTRRSSTDYALGQDAILDMLRMVHAFSTRDTIINNPVDTLAQMGCIDTITYSGASAPAIVTLGFGSDTNNTCSDSRKRWGSISADYDAMYNASGMDIEITSQGYHVNGFRVLGSITMSRRGTPGSFTVRLNEIRVSNDTMNVELDGSLTMVWNGGTGTTTPGDDAFTLTGSLTGINSRGANFEVDIQEGLVVDMSCKWLTSGVAELTPDNLGPRTIDFGTGCTQLYDVTAANDTRSWNGLD